MPDGNHGSPFAVQCEARESQARVRFITEAAPEADDDAARRRSTGRAAGDRGRIRTVIEKNREERDRAEARIETSMGETMRKTISMLALAGLLAGTGCASTADMTQLKSDVAAAQADAAEARRIAEEARNAADQAQADASAARTAADAAAAEARTASEKADRIFQRSLHK